MLEINNEKFSISTETEVKKSRKQSLNCNNKCLSISKLKNIHQSFLDLLGVSHKSIFVRNAS